MFLYWLDLVEAVADEREDEDPDDAGENPDPPRRASLPGLAGDYCRCHGLPLKQFSICLPGTVLVKKL